MKITEYGTIRNASDIKRRGRVGSSAASFADLLDAVSAEDAQTTGSLSDVAAATDVSTMLALQEISDDELKRRKALMQGKNLLDGLDTLRQQILTGGVPQSTLKNLSRELSVARPGISDPRLLSLMDEIELRAAVELAKLEMAAKNSQQNAD